MITMNSYNKNSEYEKTFKGIGIFVLAFVALCWVLTKTEENDRQIKDQIAATAPIEVAPQPPTIEEPEPQPAPKALYYTPKQLQDEFESNEVRITHKLTGNLLALKGKVGSIGLYLGKPVISISIPDSESTIKVYFDSSMVSKIAELNTGNWVLVGSENVSLNPFGVIHLRDAILISSQ